jgi:hypothetical protein
MIVSESCDSLDPLPFRRQTAEAARLPKALGDFIPEEDSSGRLRQPNPGFGRRSPLAVVEAG